MADIDQNRLTCQQELRTHDGDLYLVHLFASEAVRDQFLALSLIFCHLRRVENETTEVMVRMIRLQWWADQIDDAGYFVTGAGPVIDFARACGLDGRLVSQLVELLMLRCEDQKHVSTEQIGTLFYKSLGEVVSGKLLPEPLAHAGAAWETWRTTGAPDQATSAERLAQNLILKNQINGLPRVQRRALAPLLLLFGMCCRHMETAPRQGGRLSYLVFLLIRSITLRL